MEYLLFQTSLAVPVEEKAEAAKHIDYCYQVLNYEFAKEHSHADYWEFGILLEGNLNHYVNGRKEPYKRGTLFFLTTQDYHYLKKKDKAPLRYLNILAKETTLLKFLDAMSPDFKDKLLEGERAFSLPDNILFRVEELLHKANLLSAEQIETQGNLIFSALLLILQFLYTKQIDCFEEEKPWQRLLSEAMRTQDFLSYKIDNLCEKLNYSRSQLHRLFQKHYGMSPHDFLIDYKFRYACNLLCYSDMKIIDIANKVGYKNLSQFNVIFKNKFELTPGEYRKHNKQDEK